MKKTIIHLFIILVIQQSFAQTFQKGYGIADDDNSNQQELYDIKLAQDNIIYTSGTFRNIDYFSRVAFYGTVSKLNTFGNLLWYKGYIPEDYNDFESYFINSVFQSSSNESYCFGSFLGNSIPRAGYFLQKLSTNGELVWSKFISDEDGADENAKAIYGNNAIYAIMKNKIIKFNLSGEILNSIKIDNNLATLRTLHISNTGKLIVSGEIYYNDNWHVPVLIFNQSLSFERGTLYRSNLDFFYAKSIVEGPENNINQENYDILIGCSSGISFSIESFDGQLNWAKQILGEDNGSTLFEINEHKEIKSISNQNNLFLVALDAFYSDDASFQNSNIICKLDSNGSYSDFRIINQAPFPGNNNFTPFGIDVNTESNSYYLAGDLTDQNLTKHINYVQRGALNQLGCGEIALNVNFEDVTTEIITNPFPSSLLILYPKTSVSRNFITETITSNYDNTYCENNLSNTDFENNFSLSIFPNPTQNILNIQTQETIKVVSIYDMIGKNVSTIQITSNSLDVSNLAKGVYMMKVINENDKIFFTKFIKE